MKGLHPIAGVTMLCLLAGARALPPPRENAAPVLEPIRVESSATVRFAVTRGTVSYFLLDGAPRGFEYEILKEFAAANDLRLVPMVLENPLEAAWALDRGAADIAVLPWTEADVLGAFRAEGYAPKGSKRLRRGTFPDTGALFVAEHRPELLASLNDHLASLHGTKRLGSTLERFFGDANHPRLVSRAARPRISPYDSVIEKHSSHHGFDWRMIAALIFEESRFDPSAVSHKGATGLMQLMPIAAREVGVVDRRDPEANIRGGTRYLSRLYEMFPQSEGEDRLGLVFASYLLGPGRVFDAQRLAREVGLDDNRWWGGVAEALPLLEKPAFAKRARYGRTAGTAAVTYVRRIFHRYRHYSLHVELEPPTPEI